MRKPTTYPPVHPEDEITKLIRHVVKEHGRKHIMEHSNAFIQRMRSDWDRLFNNITKKHKE